MNCSCRWFEAWKKIVILIFEKSISFEKIPSSGFSDVILAAITWPDGLGSNLGWWKSILVSWNNFLLKWLNSELHPLNQGPEPIWNTTTASKYIPRWTRISVNWNPPFQTSHHKIPKEVFFRLTTFFFRNKKFLFKEQLLFSFLCIVKQK